MITKKDIKRFWSKVDVCGPNDCWEWLSSKNKGYGQIWLDGKLRKATHVLYYIRTGKRRISKGKMITHKVCHNPGCLNHKHLRLGTAQSNMKDMVRDGNSTKGERQPNAKLTDEEVNEIRRLLQGGGTTQKELGDMFGVAQPTISRIKMCKRWSHVD